MAPLQPQIDELKDRLDDADKLRADTHKMVADMQKKVDAMHRALMEPQLGQGDKSLLERMASVTVAIESGDRAAETLAKWLRRLAIVGAILIAMGGVLVKLELWKGPTQ